jgi:hypothetical protein
MPNPEIKRMIPPSLENLDRRLEILNSLFKLGRVLIYFTSNGMITVGMINMIAERIWVIIKKCSKINNSQYMLEY